MRINRKERPRVVVIASPDASDTYFANRMIKSLNTIGVVIEGQYAQGPGAASKVKKLLKYSTRPDLLIKKAREAAILRESGKRAGRIAGEGFGPEGSAISDEADCEVYYTKGVNDINAPENVEKILSMKPDVITVCGSSILKKPVISIPPKGVLNLHGGLSQWYRGVWTTLWAIYNEAPEYVGATVHYVSDGIDDGEIIYQGRPEIEADDNHETLYVKVVKLGVELMVRAVNDIEDGTVKSFRLTEKGRLYLKKNLTPEVIREVWRKVDSGLIRDYVESGGSAGRPLEIHEPEKLTETA